MSQSYPLVMAAFAIGLIIGAVITIAWAQANSKNVSAQGFDPSESRTTLLSIEEPTAREIHDHATFHGIGIVLARSQLRTQRLLAATTDARTVDDLRMIIGRLLNYVRLSQ